MDTVGQADRPRRVNLLSVDVQLRGCRVRGEKHCPVLRLGNLQIADVKRRLRIPVDDDALRSTTALIADIDLIASLRDQKQHIIRNLPDLRLSDLDPAADEILVVHQPQIPVALLHLHRQDLRVNPLKAQHIRRTKIHAADISSLGEILRIGRQLIDFRSDADLTAHGVDLVFLHIVIAPCLRGECERREMLLRLQEFDIDNIPELHLTEGDASAVLIIKPCRPVHGKSIFLSQLQIQKGDGSLLVVLRHIDRRIGGIVAVRPRDDKARLRTL